MNDNQEQCCAMKSKSCCVKKGVKTHVAFGVFLMIIGAVLLLERLGLIPSLNVREAVHTWWPVLVIAFGAKLVFCCKSRQQEPD